MDPRRFKPSLLEAAVVAAGIVVALYSLYVIHDVSSSGPDVAASSPATATPSPTASATPSATPAATPAAIRPFRRALARTSDVLVVGDASGDQLGEWVDLWSRGYAEDAGSPRQVVLHTWDVTGQAFVTASVRGTGPALDVWDLSYPGTAPDYARHLAQVPEEPGAVIYSFGHDRTPRAVRRAVSTTTTAVTGKWGKRPTAYVLQNPASADRAAAQTAAVRQVRRLAVADRVPVIDVAPAFRRAGPLTALLADGVLPNEAGSRVWADAVGTRLSR